MTAQGKLWEPSDSSVGNHFGPAWTEFTENPCTANSANVFACIKLCVFWLVFWLWAGSMYHTTLPEELGVQGSWHTKAAMGQGGKKSYKSCCVSYLPVQLNQTFLPKATFHFLLWFLQKAGNPGRSGCVQRHIDTKVSLYIYVCMCVVHIHVHKLYEMFVHWNTCQWSVWL